VQQDRTVLLEVQHPEYEPARAAILKVAIARVQEQPRRDAIIGTNARPGDVVLFKASRVAGLEQLAEALR
jgi:UDP-N-acetylmuramyl pentapeptide synthase